MKQDKLDIVAAHIVRTMMSRMKNQMKNKERITVVLEEIGDDKDENETTDTVQNERKR